MASDAPTPAALVPNRLLFKFELPIHRCAAPPKIDGRADKWDRRYLLPALCELDREEPFGEVLATWDDDGLYVACKVRGKRKAPRCDPGDFRHSDNLRLMTDMRDTRKIRRATRFCQHFYLMPGGGGRGGKQAVGGSTRVSRATEGAPPVGAGDIPIASRIGKTGYQLTAHLPARILSGFAPAENNRIGFFYMLEDLELGRQSLTVGDDLNWWVDPSTWPTGVLE